MLSYEEICNIYLTNDVQDSTIDSSVTAQLESIFDEVCHWMAYDANDYARALLNGFLALVFPNEQIDIDQLISESDIDGPQMPVKVLKNPEALHRLNKGHIAKWQKFVTEAVIPALNTSFCIFLKNKFGIESPAWAGTLLPYQICTGEATGFAEGSLIVFILHEQLKQRLKTGPRPAPTAL